MRRFDPSFRILPVNITILSFANALVTSTTNMAASDIYACIGLALMSVQVFFAYPS